MISTEQQNPLNELFSLARAEEPKVSYQDTEKMFLKALAVGGLGFLTAKGIAYLLKLKFSVIMLSTAGIVATTVVVIQAVGPEEPKQNTGVLASSIGAKEIVEVQPVNLEPKQLDEETISYEEVEPIIIEPVVDEEEMAVEEEQQPEPVLAKVVTRPANPKMIAVPLAVNCNPKIIQKANDCGDQSIIIKTKNGNYNYSTNRNANSQQAYSTAIGMHAPNCNKEYKIKVTQNTTENELENLKSKAEKAGIQFEYTVHIKRNHIKNLNLSMVIELEGDDQKTSQFNVSNSDNFSLLVGWVCNDDGKAIKFTEHSTTHGHLSYPHNVNIDLSQLELNLEETELALERLAENMALELSEDSLAVLEMKMVEVRERIEVKMEKLAKRLESIEISDCGTNINEQVNNATLNLNQIINESLENLEQNENFQNNMRQLEEELKVMGEQLNRSIKLQIEAVESKLDELEEEKEKEEEWEIEKAKVKEKEKEERDLK